MNRLILILILFSFQSTFAQKTIFTGYVRFLKDTNETLAFTHVYLFSSNNKIIESITTDIDGKYLLISESLRTDIARIGVFSYCIGDTSINLSNFSIKDENKIDLYIRDISKTLTANDCPLHNDSCDVVELTFDRFINGYEYCEKVYSKRKKVKLLYHTVFVERNDKPCQDIIRWYCKKHKVAF
jgi:hypothetical protein